MLPPCCKIKCNLQNKKAALTLTRYSHCQLRLLCIIEHRTRYIFANHCTVARQQTAHGIFYSGLSSAYHRKYISLTSWHMQYIYIYTYIYILILTHSPWLEGPLCRRSTKRCTGTGTCARATTHCRHREGAVGTACGHGTSDAT